MRVFITGAAGFIGSALTQDLLKAGHQVLGLARSEENAATLAKMGAEVHRGTLENLESLRSGASAADAVVHLGFIHDFSKFAENCEIDHKAILAMGEALAGTAKPFIVTAGTGMPAPGKLRTEEDPPNPVSPHLPRVSEITAEALGAQGIHTMVVRLPQVHDRAKHGFYSLAIETAKQKGVSAYIGEGENLIPACYRFDAAKVYHLALEKGEPGKRYNAVGEEGVPTRDVAEAIGRRLKIPVISIPAEKAMEHFGFLGAFLSINMPASSALTQQWLGWKPSGPGIIEDLEQEP
jgi:nucleoside-diphosphate-sugar epimerase